MSSKFMKYGIKKIEPSLAQTLCREIATDLPEYFGLPKVNEQYIQGVLTQTFFAAIVDKIYVELLRSSPTYHGTLMGQLETKNDNNPAM